MTRLVAVGAAALLLRRALPLSRGPTHTRHHQVRIFRTLFAFFMSMSVSTWLLNILILWFPLIAVSIEYIQLLVMSSPRSVCPWYVHEFLLTDWSHVRSRHDAVLRPFNLWVPHAQDSWNLHWALLRESWLCSRVTSHDGHERRVRTLALAHHPLWAKDTIWLIITAVRTPGSGHHVSEHKEYRYQWRDIHYGGFPFIPRKRCQEMWGYYISTVKILIAIHSDGTPTATYCSGCTSQFGGTLWPTQVSSAHTESGFEEDRGLGKRCG